MIVKLVKNYCEEILITTKCKDLPFHNLDHTNEVVRNVQEIGKHLNISPEDLEPIIIAAWFHDTGFCEVYKGHEDVSIALAEEFLKEHDYSSIKVEWVVQCIQATKMPQNPLNKYAEVLSDADIYHISTPSFFYRKLLLRREWELEFNKYSTDLEWHILNLKFLEEHDFFTRFGKTALAKGQKENEAKVKYLLSLYDDKE